MIMNKQEAIEKIKSKKIPYNSISNYGLGYNAALDMAICIINQINEPEKPVVPQFVADWYEENKDNFEIYLSELCRNFTCHRERLNDKLANWYEQLENKPIQTLVNMHQFGYEVEKEKLYTVELPSPNCPTDYHYILSRLKNGKIIVNRYCIEQWKKFGDCQLTEAEIKQDFDWAWQFAREVNNNE